VTTGEKVVILITAIAVTAVLAATIAVLIRNIRTKMRAKRTHQAINKIR
jgi:FlaG/FlaF family flagellin (archaellin)